MRQWDNSSGSSAAATIGSREEGRRVAAAIPGSRLVTLDSPNHILLSDEPAWPRSLAEFEAFLADRRP